jgi:hypothetical protein
VGAGSAGSNYFYVGDGVDDYTWTEVYFDGSPPSVFAPTLPVSVVSHVQAIAPVYVYDTSTNVSALKMYALASMDPNGNNRWVEKYDWLSNTWVDLEDGNGNQLYLYSLTTDNSSTSGAVSNAPFWGWTYFIGNTTWGSIYTGETGNIWNDSGTWGGVYVTSVAVASQTAVYATSNVDVCPGLNVTYPITYEACIIQYYKSGNFPGGSWVQSDTGAEQLAVDATTQTLYALDNAGGTSGNVWVSSGERGPRLVQLNARLRRRSRGLPRSSRRTTWSSVWGRTARSGFTPQLTAAGRKWARRHTGQRASRPITVRLSVCGRSTRAETSGRRTSHGASFECECVQDLEQLTIRGDMAGVLPRSLRGDHARGL